MHVLVVDHAAGRLALRCRALDADSITVDLAATLPELTEALRTNRYHAVLATDIERLDVTTAMTITRLKQPSAHRVAIVEPARVDSLVGMVEVAHRIEHEVPSAVALRAMLTIMSAQGGVVPAILGDVIGGVAAVPSVARTLDELRGTLADSRRGTSDVARILQRDPGLAAKTLQLANGGFARASAPIHDLEQAAALLGLQTLREVIVASAAFSAAEEMGAAPDLVRIAQRHGVAAAVAAQQIPGLPAHASTGALLLDVGLPLMSLAWPEQHAAVLEFCMATEVPLAEEERRRLGASHADAGALLARRWSMPLPISDMIAGHHFIPRSGQPDDRALGFVVHFAAQRGRPAGVDPFEPDLQEHVPEWVLTGEWVDTAPV